MTKEKTLDFEKYAYASLASQLGKSEDGLKYFGGAVDLLEKNLDFGEDGQDLYRGFVNEETMNKFVDIYDQKFKIKLAETKVSDLYSWYDPALKGASEDQKELIKAEFDKFGEDTYGKVMEAYLNAKEITESKTKNFSEDQKEKAKKDLEKYEKFVAPDHILRGYMFEGLRAKAVKESKKKTFDSLEEMLKK